MDFRVRRTGSEQPHPKTTIRFRRNKGRYEGHSDLEVQRATVKDVDFGRTAFRHFLSVGSKFERCSFDEATFEAGSLSLAPQSLFRECTFRGSDLRNIDLGQARFEECLFEAALIRDWASDAAEFVGCRFSGKVEDSRFSGRPWGMWAEPGYLNPVRTRNEFRENDFRAAEIIGTDFVWGVDVHAQLFPKSEDYVLLDRWHDRVARAIRVIEDWVEPDRSEARILIGVYTDPGYEEQASVFIHKWSLDIPRHIAGRVWDLLAVSLP